jgi:hypothetical protein
MILALSLGLAALQTQQDVTPDKAPRAFKRPVAPRSPPQKWVTFSQFPDKALEGRAFGRVRFLLDVDAAGNVSACHILATSGFWILDEETCSVLKHRARFIPALDADGKPATSTYMSAVTWSRGDKSVGQWEALMKAIGEPVRVTLTAKKVPDGYRDPPVVRIRFDGAGKPAECRIELKSGSAAVDRAACAQVMAGAEPAKSTPLVGALDTRMFQVFFFEEFTG